MNNQMKSILRKAKRGNEKLNIITFTTHERYESSVCKTGHNFYSIRTGTDWTQKTKNLPSNYNLLETSKNATHFPAHIGFDLVLSQHETHIDVARHISFMFHIPLVSLAHTMTKNIWDKKNTLGDVNVFAWKEQAKGYGFCEKDNPEFNMYCVDLDVFSPGETRKINTVLSACSKWQERDATCGFSLWKDIVGYEEKKKKLPYKVIGNNPGLSTQITDIDKLVNEYRKAPVFLNTALLTTGPLTSAEAMACGCPVVSTNVGAIAKTVIKHGVNGFIGKNERELRHYCNILLKDKKLAEKMGKEARKSAEEHLQEDRFINKWNDIFNKAASMNSSNIISTKENRLRII